MDDLLCEFLTETSESLESLDVELVKLEQDPNDPDLLSNIFRLVHTIKGTCGFLGLPRLEAVAHAGENILGKFRDGNLKVNAEAVTLILAALDRIKLLLSALEETEAEPDGDDAELIAQLNAMANGCMAAPPAPTPSAQPAPPAEPALGAVAEAAPEPAEQKKNEPLIALVGGLSAVDAAIEIMYRKALKDPDLAPFFEGVDMTLLAGGQLGFLAAALGGPDPYTGRELGAIHKPLVDRGLDETHFDRISLYLVEALHELEVTDDVIDQVMAVIGGTKNAVLNIAEDDAAPEAPAEAVVDRKSETAAAAGPVAENTGPKEASVVSQSVRVNLDMLEDLMTMVSELVLSRNQLLQILRNFEDSEFAAPLQRLNLVTTDLQEGIMKTRMQPIGNAWSKLPRIVRDLSQELGKKIDLKMVGAETELDRQVLEMIKDPLTHMVRNSGDHGIEQPEDRIKAGKPEVGKIVLKAYHEGGHIIIEIRDDGRGVNIEAVSAKILENGLATEAELENMSDKQIQQFIFKAGFSTAAKVTNVSGRGVGMDVVRTNVEKIGGNVELKSEEGKGSTFVVKIPLTLAIVSALIVECAGEKFAIPQISVDELVRVTANSEHRLETINETPVLRLRNRLLPLVELDELLKLRPKRDLSQFAKRHVVKTTDLGQAQVQKSDDDGAADAESADAPPADSGPLGVVKLDRRDSETFIVVTRVGTYSFGIVVDQVFESEEIVVKPVTPILRDIPLFSGNTILGDGSVIMILDPNGIAATTGEVSMTGEEQNVDGSASQETGDGTTTFLVFRAGSAEPKAVPLALVARLEEIELDKVEQSECGPVVQYRGQLMPLISVDDSFKMVEEGRQHVVVFTESDRSMGLMVDEIVDIVEDRLKIELGSRHGGSLGTVVIAERATVVIDTSFYLTKAFGDWFNKQPHESALNGGKAGRVLLVDDSPFFRNLLTPLLGAAGYVVTAVEGGEEALSLRDAGQSFDVIISDIEMPGMSGFDFAQAIRRDGSWQDTPVVALSAYSSETDLDKGREAGFTDYVPKLDRDALLETLTQTLTNVRGAA